MPVAPVKKSLALMAGHGRVIIKVLNSEEKTEGGVFVASASTSDSLARGRVVDVGKPHLKYGACGARKGDFVRWFDVSYELSPSNKRIEKKKTRFVHEGETYALLFQWEIETIERMP